MRPWAFHQFSISFCSIIFCLLMTPFPTSPPRELFLICRKTAKGYISKPRREHHAGFTSTSRHNLGTEDTSDQHGTYEQILMLLNFTSSPCLLLIFVCHFKKQAFRIQIQTRLYKPHFSNGITQTTLKLNGVISDIMKFLLPRQNTENYITSGTVRQLTIKFPGTSIYLTVVLFAYPGLNWTWTLP